MNKLVVSNSEELRDIIVSDVDMYVRVNLTDTSDDIQMDVMDNMNLMVFETSKGTSNKITYNLRSNANLIINKLSSDNSDVTVVNLLGYGASVTINNSVINYGDNVCVQTINHLANKTTSNITNHGINVSDRTLNFTVNGIVGKEFRDCLSNQDNKIINMSDGKSFIFPNLVVDNNLVDIYHSAYIGTFSDEVMFYLKSRGIREEDCNNILIKGLLIGKMELNEDEREELKVLINNI